MEACPHCYQWQLQYAPSGTNKNAYIAYCEQCGFNEERESESEQVREDKKPKIVVHQHGNIFTYKVKEN